jgi:hypothetical protein
MSAALRGCFVTGTDTGVGKTVVAAAIVASLRRTPTGRLTTSCSPERPDPSPPR